MIANKPTESQMATPDITLTDVGYAADMRGTREPWNNQVDEAAQYGGYSDQRAGYTSQQGGYSGYDEGYFPQQEPWLFDPQGTNRSMRKTSPWDQGSSVARRFDSARQ